MILDPFAGCGSTLVEASYAGIPSVGIDVNGVGHLLQRTFTYPFKAKELDSLINFVSGPISSRSVMPLDEALDMTKEIPRIEHWFGPNSIRALAWAMFKVRKLRGPAADAAAVAVSRTVVNMSRQQSDTQYRATKDDRSLDSNLRLLRQSFKETAERLASHAHAIKASSHAVFGDARDPDTFTWIEPIDLVITSPPYPNAYEYWLYHKYRMFWMDMNPIWTRSREIGARPFYSGTGKLGPLDFQRDIEHVFKNLDSICSKNARQYWVVGDSVIKGEIVDNAALITEVARKFGWRVIAIQRNLNRQRSSFQGVGRQKSEMVLEMNRG
jgi:site-specific DNA-methyltransferase (cytosine-N4-specific)